MKITDIQVERYGVWNHLALPLQSAGFNVFYGPNEAGKTTLLHLIRDVLYGRQSPEWSSHPMMNGPWLGALKLTHAERYSEVRRGMDAEGREVLEFQELDPSLAWNAEPDWATMDSAAYEAAANDGLSAEAALEKLLANSPARLFRHIFAIGLSELQELATLHDEEVAEQIYSLSLGPEGQRLISVSSQSGQPQNVNRFFARTNDELTRLLKQDKELEKQLEAYSGQRERHQELLEKQARFEEDAQVLKTRQADLKRELKGHELLHRVWEPWHLIREYEAELRTIPRTGGLGADVDPKRLEALETEIRDLIQKRKPLLAEISRLRKTIREAKADARQKQHAAEIEGFLNQRAFVVQIEREKELSSARARELKTEFEARQKALGPKWSVERLTAIDTSRAAYTKLVDAAQGFQSCQNRQDVLRKRYEKLAALVQKRQTDFDQAVSVLPEKSLQESLEETRKQLREVRQLTRLKRRETELEDRVARRAKELASQQDRPQVPEWVPGFLLFLAISGLFLSVLGFYTSLKSNGIAGAILGLVGLAGFAIARGFQVESEDQTLDEASPTQTPAGQDEQSLAEVRTAIKRSTPVKWRVTAAPAELVHTPVEKVIASKLKAELLSLKKLQKRGQKLESRRQILSRMRQAMQARQRDVAKSRQDWCAVLKQCGLEETLSIEAAFELWQKIAEALEHLRTWNTAREAAELDQHRHDAFCQRLAQFGAKSGHANLNYQEPLSVLDRWQKEVAILGDDNGEEKVQLRELREKRREANRLKQKLIAARTARSAMLAQAGAKNRAEFESKREAANRRAELQELLHIAKAELAAISQSNTDLAIVEEDLLAYKSGQTQDAIDLLKLELDDLETTLGESFENLGSVRQEIKALETDRRPASVRFEREAVRSKLRECLTKNAALYLAQEIVDEIRLKYEQSSQPRILEIASEYLAQLTCGKYQKIWTSLGERRLLITEGDDNHFSVEKLSNGTREQLFLALRLALVSEFAERGIELPMILDDVLVNFDQHRTEAAIQTLIEFADRGHQVLLFTSHLHLARLCETQGIEPVWLPAHHAFVEHRRAG
jgi:uncharacterized protein YhaN